MKNIPSILLFGFLLVLTSCSSTKKSSPSKADTPEKIYTTLADFLRKNSNVQIHGIDPNIRLQIRGLGSLTSDTRPFIYLDRNPIGRDYTRANNAVNPNNIKKVEVISSLAKLARYGGEGHSGIIIIHTKSNN